MLLQNILKEKKHMKTDTEKQRLTTKQMSYLRGLGHHLKPLVTLGREGITVNVIKAADEVLDAHELVKVKIGNGCLLERGQAAEILAERTGSRVVQILGKTFLVFRGNPERHENQRIKLP